MSVRRKLTIDDAAAVKQALQPMARLLPGDRRGPLAGVEPAVPVAFQSREHTVERIRSLWDHARDTFVEIGRWLNAAKQALDHGDWEDMVEREMPFTPARARQLRQVAEFVDSNIIPAERLPPYDTIILELSKLSPDELAKAQRENLVRPDVRRAEIQEFRRRQRASRSGTQARSEIEDLQAERKHLLARLDAVNTRLAELGA